MTYTQWAAVLALIACALTIVMIADDAWREPVKPAPVKIEDQKTWRRTPSQWERMWGHCVGAFSVGVGLSLLVYSLA